MEPHNHQIEISLEEVAELMRVTAARVLRLVRDRRLPAIRSDGDLRFRLEEVTTWMYRQSFAIRPRAPRRRSFDAAMSDRA